jgi:transposase
MKRPSELPEIIDKDPAEIKAAIEQIKASSMSDEVKKMVIKCVEMALWLPVFLQNKAISLHRLRTMIFGKGYNKRDLNNANPLEASDFIHSTDPINPAVGSISTALQQSPEPEDKNTLSSVTSNGGTKSNRDANEGSTSSSSETITPEEPKKKTPGHGRMPHTVYSDAIDINLLLTLTIGDGCPTDCGGKLGPYKPGVIIRVKGQRFAKVYRYHVDKVRCNLCGIIIRAELPSEIGDNKYDESFIALLALMKYFVAIPFYRQEHFQRLLGFPLPDATQWRLIEQLAGFCYAVFNELKRLAGNARLLHNDDTSLKILEVIKAIKEGTAGERTGMYTTGILADYEGHPIALFLKGRKHSGEHIAELLKYRTADKGPILQMADALSANIPKGMQTILCNCLGHGFRKFNELLDYFGVECLTIVKKLSKVFEYDAYTRGMTHEERLLYHQRESQPIMDELKLYMACLLDERLVEPNSELGKAIKYMQRHWVKLTRFLTVLGAPIDNNVAERMLKIAIRNRKAALFYKTTYGASIGGMITSIIYTCDLAKQNPLDYLIALQVHHAKVTAHPEHWLPWNYQDAMALLEANDARVQAASPPSDCLVAA